MADPKALYVVYVAFPSYVTPPFRAELTETQALEIAGLLDARKASGMIDDYYLGPPKSPEYVHTLFLTAQALQADLEDLIALENRPSA